jgi:hypothetical protein
MHSQPRIQTLSFSAKRAMKFATGLSFKKDFIFVAYLIALMQ